MTNVTCPLGNLVYSIHSYIVMYLKIGVFPASKNRLMIREDCKGSTIDFIDEVSDSILDGQEFSNVGGITLLGRLQSLGPQTKAPH